MKKIIGVIAAVLFLAGVGVTVGGWVTNDTKQETESAAETETDKEANSKDGSKVEHAGAEKEGKGDQEESTFGEESELDGVDVDEITYNTDAPLSGLTVTIADYLGKDIIFKVVNDSDVCYKYLDIDVYFKCDPLPNRKPTDEEYHNGYSFWNIPAYSETYHLAHAFVEIMGKGSEGTEEVYYPFDFPSDPYRIVIGEENLPMSEGYKVSDKLIQNAMDYVEVQEVEYDEVTNKLATVVNKAKRHVEFTGFVRFDDQIYEVVQNGSELHDSTYEDIIPACGVQFRYMNDEYYDCNTLYTDPYDLDVSKYHNYRVFIGNAWFNDEVEEPEPKPTAAK